MATVDAKGWLEKEAKHLRRELEKLACSEGKESAIRQALSRAISKGVELAQDAVRQGG